MLRLRLTHFAIVTVASLALVGCGAGSGDAAATHVSTADLVVDMAAMDAGDVRFVPFDAGGKARVLVAKTGEGIVAKLDTCNSCNGSPKAYYESDGVGTIKCQNCGFDFSLDELDERKGGCSPVDVPHEVSGDTVTFARADLDAAEPLFANIER